MASRPSDKPATVLNLDEIDSKEAPSAAKEPFKVKAGDVTVEFTSLDDLDWQTVADLGENFNIQDFLFAVIEDDDQLNAFFEQRYKSETMKRLLRSYFAHYDLEMPGEARLNRAARRRR